jgi:leucyl/phenylalanyl-tRNA--protein transferase
MDPFSRSAFPAPHTADEYGLVAVSEQLSVELLLDAYQHGIFPWTESPVGWFSPDPRAIFELATLRLPRRLSRMVRKGGFRVTWDTAFREVMLACKQHHEQHGSESSWITTQFIDAYSELFALGYAHSVEVWQQETLVGGIYGVQCGGVCSGESMFYHVPNASKVAFAALVQLMRQAGVALFDAQVLNPHTEALGATEISRAAYLERLQHGLRAPVEHARGPWPASWQVVWE